MITNKLFNGFEVKAYRMALGMSQEEMAKKFMTTRQTIVRIESDSDDVCDRTKQYITLGLMYLWNEVADEDRWRLAAALMGFDPNKTDKDMILEHIGTIKEILMDEFKTLRKELKELY